MRYRSLALLALAPIAAPAAPASAQTGVTVTGGVDLVSDYRYRGTSLSGEDPAVQGWVEAGLSNGLYASVWASSLEDTPINGEVEIDLNAGWRGEIASGTSIDLGVTYYLYPDKERGAGASDFFEPRVTLSHTLGPVQASVGANYAWAQAATGNADNLYLWGGLSAGIPATPVTLAATIGHSDGSLSPGGEYWDWSLGAKVVQGPVTLGVAYVDTDLGNARTLDAGILFSIGMGF